jgi:hypothetical protein
VVACPAGSNGDVCADPATNTGLALCDDRTGTQTACISDPQCVCASSPTECTRCVVATATGAATAMVKPCQPGIGYLYLTQLCSESEPCRVEVLSVGGGWKAEVSPDVSPYTFGHAATNVGPKAVLRVKRAEGTGVEIPGMLGASTGEVVLGVVTAGGQAQLKAIDLQIAAEAGTCEGTGPYQMYCTP